MKATLILLSMLLIAGCEFMQPKNYKLNSDVTNNGETSWICGDHTFIIVPLYYHEVTTNMLAIDNKLVPPFDKKLEDIFGLEYIPSEHRYCNEVNEGNYNILILASRSLGIVNTYSSGVLSIGKCNVNIEAGYRYLLTPKDNVWKNQFKVYVTTEDEKKTAGVCNMSATTQKGVFKKLHKLRGEPE
jgi:hypothetical protein